MWHLWYAKQSMKIFKRIIKMNMRPLKEQQQQ